MKKGKSNVKKVILIILACLIFAGGIFCAIYILSKQTSERFYDVKIDETSGEITLSASKSSLSPNDNIISRPIRFILSEESDDCYVRAKIVFENYSNDSRVLSFVSQLNFNIKNIVTHSDAIYGWTYSEEDNSFYLTTGDENLKVVTKYDDSYVFLDRLIVPNTIEQMSTLNSNGDNVQINEDIIVHVMFEAVQSTLAVKTPSIENVREYFDLNALQTENGYISQNGFITKCTLNQDCLVLPKTVGNDYILGIKGEAFENLNIKQIIVPASYIMFDNKAFSNLISLNFVALKNQVNIVLKEETFTPNSGLEIYTTKTLLDKISENYSTFNYYTSFKQALNLDSSDISTVDITTQYIYSDNVTSFEGDFKALNALKVVDLPVLESINENMFASLTSLVSVECPNAKTVGASAFNGCIKLASVVFDKNVESIGESCFFGCANLQEAQFTKTLKIIPSQSFRGCTSLTTISLNQEQTEVKASAFYGCSKLKSVKISSLLSCEDYGFGECANLKWIFIENINENLTISDKAFSRTNGAISQNLNILFNNKNVKTNFETKNPQTSSVTAFAEISKGELKRFEGSLKTLDLSDLNLLEKITKIGNSAFKDNKTLTNLTLPYSIKEIGNNFIDNAEKLNKITFKCYVCPRISEKTFENVNENLQIFVPTSLVEIYKQTYNGYNLNIIGSD